MFFFVVLGDVEEIEEARILETMTEQTQQNQQTGENAELRQQITHENEGSQGNGEKQTAIVKKTESSFCLGVEFGKSGGKVSCKGVNNN